MAEIIQDSHKFLVNTTLIAQWEDTLPYPTTRKIYRHESNEGSVIEFDMFGKKVKLFVADAKYRASGLIYDSSLEDHVNPNITASDFCINGSADDPKQALTYNKTDIELQSLLAAFKNDDAAWINTNALMRNSNAEAARHCREQNISSIGTLDLPNLYELVVMYLEADNIDALDPTFNSNKLMGLGMKSTNGRFSSDGIGRGYWSSTEYSSQYAWGIWCDGTLIGHSNWQNKTLCVAPVKELTTS